MKYYFSQLRYTNCMTIVWNQVTWYSKLLAAIFFIFVVPLITFHIGKEYEKTQLIVQQVNTNIPVLEEDDIEPIPEEMAIQSGDQNSGIYGEAKIGPTCPVERVNEPCPDKPYQGHLAVRDSKGVVVTTTETRSDGKFLLMLPPGKYTLSLLSQKTMPSLTPVSTTVTKGSVARVNLLLDSGIR